MSETNPDFVVSPSWIYVYGHDTDSLLDRALRVSNPQAFWQNKRRHPKAPRASKYHRLYDKFERRFPKGVLKKAYDAFRNMGRIPALTQAGRFIEPPDPVYWPDSLEPWPHQTEAIDAFWKNEFGLVVIPTRGGKALIGLACASRYVRHHPVLYLVTKIESRRDIVAHWKKYFDIAPVFEDASDAPGLHVITYQLALQRDLSHFAFVVADEAHLTGADRFHDNLMRCDGAWYRLGLTGTASGRNDGKDIFIEAAVGPVVYQIDRSPLIESGVCATGKVLMVPISGELHAPSNWIELESEGIVENDLRTLLLSKHAKYSWKGKGQILVLVSKIKHGHRFGKILSDVLGFHVDFVHGGTDAKTRRQIYDDFRLGKMKALVASNIFNDSITLPGVSVLVIAAGGKSAISTRQRLGRALTGDKEVIIIDAYDNQHRVLQKHSAVRQKAYHDEGYEVEMSYVD